MQTATLAPTPLFVEKRFPLRLSPTITGIRDLYQTGKSSRWDPQRDIPWAEMGVERYEAAEREAARWTWSRRAWIEATGLKETPSLLIRFCLEDQRESDPKFFLTVRGTEEAWHVDCFDRVANRFGGLVERPSTPVYGALFNRSLHRRALHAERSLDAYVVTHCAFEDGLELELFKAYRQGCANPVLAAVLDRCIADKERHASFGWLYAETRAPGWTGEQRRIIAAEVEEHMRSVELGGYHCPWLSNAAGIEAEADAVCARAGLGAASVETEATVLREYLAAARKKLRIFGIELPEFHHALVGSF